MQISCGSRRCSSFRDPHGRRHQQMLGRAPVLIHHQRCLSSNVTPCRYNLMRHRCQALHDDTIAGSIAEMRPLLFALSLADAAAAAQSTAGTDNGWLAPLTNSLETVMKFLQTGLATYHVPYTYGWSIILLTLIVKIVTFPFLKKQTESALAVQALKPRIDRIKARYGDDKKRVQKETSILYEEAGVNPLAGCLPTLATIPIFIGLYRTLTNVANEGLLDSEGFYWIPSLAAPTSIAARQAGSGIAWLYPFVDGHPPIGWHDASLYLVLPVLLVACQYASSAYISPPPDTEDESAKTTKTLMTFLPLMIGWFSLNVPSGLSLYYLSNTVLTSMIQIYLKKLGGATITINDLGPVTKLGSGRRLGPVVTEQPWQSSMALQAAAAASAAAAAAVGDEVGASSAAGMAASTTTPPPASATSSTINRRARRKKLVAAISSS